MSDDIPKQDLLAKLLKMTSSANDGEALVAMRKDINFSEDERKNFTEVVGSPVVVAPRACPYGFVWRYGACRPI
jgi:hypothetical protein